MPARKSILLGASFAALMLVIGASAFAIWRNARAAQNRVAALHDEHLVAGNALASIRASVYLIGILTRDYLLDPDPARQKQYEDQFKTIRAEIGNCLRVLDENVELNSSPESRVQKEQQRAAVERLRRGVDSYWDPTALVLNWTTQQKLARRADFLRERAHRRDEITQLAGQVEKLIAENYSREKLRTSRTDQEFQTSLAWTAGAALLLCLAIAAMTMARMMVLERRSQISESELRRLSAQVRTAQEQERKYLSRELHDQVGQMLTGLRMEFSSIARLHADAESEVAARIAHAMGIVEQTLRVVRNIAMLLRPSMLDDLGLSPALAWLIKEISRRTVWRSRRLRSRARFVAGRLPHMSLPSGSGGADERFPPREEVSHGLMTTDQGWVIGTIADNGCGFDPARSGGMVWGW